MCNKISMSLCCFQDDTFDVMIVDEDTGQEIRFSGTKVLTDEEHEMTLKIAPACVWTEYKEVRYENGN